MTKALGVLLFFAGEVLCFFLIFSPLELFAIGLMGLKLPASCGVALKEKDYSYVVGVEDISIEGHGAQGYLSRVTLDHGESYVALKVANDLEKQEFLRREARYLKRLNSKGGHPSIVQYKELRQSQDGHLLLLTEWIGGKNYMEYLGDLDITRSNFKEVSRQFLSQMKQLHDGIRFLHEHHIVHLDIKSKNLMIDKLGNLKIVDFASASNFFSSRGRHYLGEKTLTLTKDSSAPELRIKSRDVNAFEAGPEADYFSLGYVLSEWTNKTRNFLSEDQLTQAQNQFLRNIEELSSRLMSPIPSDRPGPVQVNLALKEFEESLGAF